MMTIAPTAALPQLSAQPLPAEATAPEGGSPGHSFAQLLEQRRSHAAVPEHEPARTAAPSPNESSTHSPASATGSASQPEHGHTPDATPARGQRPTGPARDAGKSRDAGSRAASARADAKADSDRKAAATADGKPAGAADDKSAVDPSLAAWLAGLQLPDTAAAQAAVQTAPIAAAAPGSAAAADTAQTAASDGALALGAIAGSSQAASGASETAKPGVPSAATTAAELARAGLPRGGDARQSASDASADDTDQGERGGAGQTTDLAPSGETLKSAADKLASSFALPVAAVPQPAANHITAADAAQAAQAASNVQTVNAAAPGRDPGRPLPVALDTPITSPEFPQAIGVRIGMLARDGIEHAELQLNPAEMGPVSVRIVVDGEQARVDFGADFAATRQAIEASLPELAGALRDAGLTLTGGGVSQHAHPQREGQPGAPGHAHGGGRGDPSQPGDTPAPAQRRTVRAGGVDLYA